MKNFGLIIKGVLAVVLLIPFVIWGLMLSSSLAKEEIVKNGTSAVAQVDNIVLGVESNGTKYYKLQYWFLDENGVSHTGETDAHYTQSQAYDVKNRGLEIKYDKNFNSVRADYKFEITAGYVILPIIGSVSIVFIVLFILELVKMSNRKKAVRLGTPLMATYVAATSDVRVNNRPIYKMTYAYENKDGKSVTKKTGSVYEQKEIEFFEMMKNFEIKVYKGESVVTEEVDYLKLERKRQIANATKKRCVHCGTITDIDDKSCKNCGSNTFEEII